MRHAATTLLAGALALGASLGAGAIGVATVPAREPQDDARAAELARSLGALTSSSSTERLAARHWLATNVEERDFAALADAVRSGDAQARRGLREVLAGDDGHLGLAARFAAERDVPLAGLGGEAIGEMLARLGGGLDRRGRSASAWLAAMRELAPLRVAIDPERGTLAEQLDRFARLVPGAPPIVLDPELDLYVRAREVDRAPASEVLSGRFEEVLAQLCELQRVELEVFGGEGGAELWIHVRKDGSPASLARELFVEWCAAVVRPRDVASARANARALATSGWPAALAWLERRALDGDAAARSGIVLAAGRGLVAPSLTRPARVRELAAEIARGLAAGTDDGRRYAQEVARALARIPPAGPQGEDLALEVVRGWGELAYEEHVLRRALAQVPPLGPGSSVRVDALVEGGDELARQERMLRLVALEGMRSGAAAVERAVLSALSDPSPTAAASGERLQALRALAVLPGRRGAGLAADALGAPAATWAWAGARGLRGELVDLACELRLAPPQLELAAGAPFDEGLDLFTWWVFHGIAADTPEAAREVERRLSDLVSAHEAEGSLEQALAGLARRGAGAWLAQRIGELQRSEPASGAQGGALERLAIACGGLAPARRAALLETALGAAPEDEGAYRSLGALAADAELGDRARAALLERFGHVREELALAVLSQAAVALSRARLDDERAAFEAALRDPAPGTWFLGRWRRAVAELEPGPEPIALDRLERGLFR